MSWQLPTPDPSPDQIRQRCLTIQATWTDEQRDRRSRHYANDRCKAKTCVPEPHWQPPVIHVTLEVAAALEAG